MIAIGLDLSLRSTGVAIVPADWDLDWRRVVTRTVGYPLRKDATDLERAQRVGEIATVIVPLLPRGGHVVIERYPYGATSQAFAAGELHGVIKDRLRTVGIPFSVVSESTARRMFGKVPRKNAKVWVAAELRRMGAPAWWSDDECDAFVMANHWLSENGGCAVGMAA
jgi:hypothetical protein